MIAARPTCAAFISLVYLICKPTARPATVLLYRNAVHWLDQFNGRPTYVDELCVELLENFRVWRLAQGAAAPTVNKDVRHLLSLWRLAIRRGYSASDPPFIEELAEELDNLPCWSMDELARILKACLDEGELFLTVRAPLFFTALLLTIYDAGPRIGAIMDTLKTSLDWETGTLQLVSAVQKQRQSQVIALSPQTLEAIRAMGDYPGALLFPWPFNVNTLRRRYTKILKRAGLPAERRDKFHKIRRTSATHLFNELGPAATQEHLGHSDWKVTERYLDKTKLTRTQQSAKALPRPLF